MKSSLCALIFCGCHALLTIQLSNGLGFSVENITLLQGGSDFRVLDLDVPNPPGVFFGGNGAIIYHSYYTDVESQEDIGVCYDDSGFSCIHGNPLSEDCYNYIRYVSSLGQQCDSSSCPKLYFCGTNALNPACFLCNFTVESGLLNCTFVDNEDDVSDQSCETENPDGGYTFPRTRDENATVLYINDTLQFYFGARESRTNGKSLIGHRIVDPSDGSINPSEVRTRSDSDKAVSDANFVGTPFARGDYVYFLYRETSEEYASLSTGQDNRVGIVYSRIARVCEGDTGYTAGSDTVWSSFLKQRLVCKKAGEDEFSATIYDEIQDFIYDGNETIHAIFMTARYAPPMSALCTFNLTEIDTVFDTGTFYGSDGQTANDLWRENSSPPSPRPGLDCGNRNTADTFFQRDYPNLKPDAIEEAVVTHDEDRFSQLALFKQSPYTLLIGSGKTE
ncbi:semaphorin-1A-like [Diadema antillarum]|uniref:semaphorin-1A-like n=1 Tax=Diadema antillarum TaxID=105358 RepID=UPI003A88B140